MEVKICPNNTASKSTWLKDQLSQHSELTITNRRCLNYCGQCIVEVFCIINQQNIASDSSENLYPKIRNMLKATKDNDRKDQKTS
ncbi:DUF1450 domain-containing protein [Alkalihalobacillus pseudalcaliphilus]|uniref:DUF1450 domain-containing protein n=1 Tax=Alkalihalobacillus pseudalcaliphilus TaxID=79884 RepID=UPI00064D8F24|nr:DUF1450 domain-containing protein [Alkalihalobacillus pseudalcaliphilus]KMK75172.1 hypothetical protein AB990_17170 [Alkalihalobacillus pseudalcaliphilus]